MFFAHHVEMFDSGLKWAPEFEFQIAIGITAILLVIALSPRVWSLPAAPQAAPPAPAPPGNTVLGNAVQPPPPAYGPTNGRAPSDPGTYGR